MILFISDVHGLFDLVNEQIMHAENLTGKRIQQVIVLGDFGLFKHFLDDFFNIREQSFLRPLAFIEGNHEDFTNFEENIERYKHHFTHLKRGEIHEFERYRFLCLGGSAYMDMHNTPMGCEILDRDIDNCLKYPGNSVDVVLSHDSPCGIGLPQKKGFEYLGDPGFKRGLEILHHFEPEQWIFGHHHQWFESKINKTNCIGLPESYKGYAVLDSKGHIKTIANTLKRADNFQKPLIHRFFSMFGL